MYHTAHFVVLVVPGARGTMVTASRCVVASTSAASLPFRGTRKQGASGPRVSLALRPRFSPSAGDFLRGGGLELGSKGGAGEQAVHLPPGWWAKSASRSALWVAFWEEGVAHKLACLSSGGIGAWPEVRQAIGSTKLPVPPLRNAKSPTSNTCEVRWTCSGICLVNPNRIVASMHLQTSQHRLPAYAPNASPVRCLKAAPRSRAELIFEQTQ